MTTTHSPSTLDRIDMAISTASAASIPALNGNLRWWQFRSMQQKLGQFVEIMGGHQHFSVTFAAGAGCYTDFARKRVVIDPEMVPCADDAEHLAVTKGMLAHESAHVRFTTPSYGLDTTEIGLKTQLLAKVCNILEDERIERAMSHEFWGAEKYIKLLKLRMWQQATPLDPSSDDPSDVLMAILFLRFGNKVKGQLSPKNEALFEQCRPYVNAAWNGVDTHVVRECAEEILKILDLVNITQAMIDKLPEQHCNRSMNGRRDKNAQRGPGGKTSKNDCPVHGKKSQPQQGQPSQPSQQGDSQQGQQGADGENDASGDGQKPSQGGNEASDASGGATGEDTQGQKDENGEPGKGAGAGSPDECESGGANPGGNAPGDKAGQGQVGDSGQGQGEAQGAGEGQGQGEGSGEGGSECSCPEGGKGQGKGQGSGQSGQGQPGQGQPGQGSGDGSGDDTDGDADGDQDGDGENDGDDDGDLLTDEEVKEILEEAARELGTFFGRGAGGPADRKSPLKPRTLSNDAYSAAVARSQVLRKELERVPPKPRIRSVENGPRYSFRGELRNSERPMRKREQPTKKRRIAIGVLVDCSGSMGGAMDEVRKAVLGTYFAADALGVPMACWGFSDWHSPAAAAVVTYGMNPKLAPEYIAGLDAIGGTVLKPAFVEACKQIKAIPADRRVLMVIHDGQPSDMAASVAAIKAEKRSVEVVGVFLGDGRMNADLIAPMRELFADRLISANDADQLMAILGGFLARLLRPTSV